jgi:hypothetical protein
LDGPDKIRTAEDVDSIVSAQIPDPVTQPVLYGIITKSMVHGPCGDINPDAKCMVDGKCSKHFPKEFCEHTVYGEDGYPKYARPNNGRSFEKTVNGERHVYDNRDVVSYHPYCSAKYKCHINVEICASVEAVKYIHKYIYKGYDRTTIEIAGDQERDEIKEYLDARYISAAESLWHIFEFSMHAESPSVYRLPVHLKDQNLIYYNPDDDINEVLDRASGKTALTAWFDANRQYPEAHDTLYQNFPSTWVYVQKHKKWKPRERGAGAIGRMYFASPAQGERFYMRLLLTSVSGATSFEHLRTVNGVECDSYKAACIALGLLRDDQEWVQCLTEAGDMQTGFSLRQLFAIILLHCHPTSPEVLWDQFKHKICDDLKRKLQRMPAYRDRQFTDEQVYGYGLYLLEKILQKSDKSLNNYPPMPLAPMGPDEGEVWQDTQPNYILTEQRDYDVEQLKAVVERNLGWFNPEQRNAYDAAMNSVNEKLGKMIFIHSAGGCGKTLVCNTIAAAVRSQEKIALCVASSGIAALLLEGGRTAHSRFKIPLDLFDTSIANIIPDSFMHEVLQVTEVIIWDEVPMQHKYAMDSVDRAARDLLKNDKPFGGITVVFGGDFRQTLPIVPRGVRQQIISASLCRGKLWKDVEVHYLVKNMRLDRTPESDEHAKWLLDIGAGRNYVEGTERVEIPEDMCCENNTVESLIEATYPGIGQGHKEDQYFLDRTLLSCKNDDVDDFNAMILEKFPGEKRVMMSSDSVQLENQALNGYQPYPAEYLNSLNASGIPLAKLALKVGAPIMLLRNLDPSKGLCNGTRMIVTDIRPRVLRCRIITGDERFSGKTVMIPRIELEPKADKLPIPLQRRQFPVRLAFAMTINKSQGQSVKHVGLNLQTPVFSHGQLYVALSRCTSRSQIKVLLPDECEDRRTLNVVYKEILRGFDL